MRCPSYSDDSRTVVAARLPESSAASVMIQVYRRDACGKKGNRLPVLGVLVPRGSASDRYTAFADEYKFRAGDFLLIPCGIAAVANHSSQPNLVKVVDGEEVFLEMTRDVAADEELCFAYSEYARERYGIV